MENVSVLIADGDIQMSNLLNVTLKAHDYMCIKAASGESAIFMANSYNPDIILLDLVLPDTDGIEVIRKIRSFSDVPIIVISVRKDEQDKVMALDAGADDYLTKPFFVEELLARLRVMERRYVFGTGGGSQDAMFENGNLRIDYDANCVYVCNGEIHLTPIEYRLLCMLARNVDKVLTHTYITRDIWGASYDNNVMTLRTFMASLRKKIESADSGRRYIVTHTGVGYRMIKVH